jgi:uncharacterized protein (TIGR02391 family)
MEVELLISKEDFSDQLAKRWAQGQTIGTKYVSGDTDYRDFALVKREFDLWNSYNYTWLGHVFADTTPFPEGPNQIQKSYKLAGAINTDRTNAVKMGMSPDSLRFQHMFFKSFLNPKVDFLEDLQQKIDFFPIQKPAISFPAIPQLAHAPSPLAALHPTIQQAAGSLFATGHYRQALLDAYIAVDNAVREKSQLTGSGTRLMEVAFSPGNPVLKIGDSPDEQQGFMALFRGAMLAIRNPKAYSLNGTHDAQRALEWLSFASVLLRNLDEAVLQQPNSSTP